MTDRHVPAPESVLESFYLHEQQQPEQVLLVQPLEDDQVVEYSWRQVGDQVRRMAAWLRGMQLPAGSHVGILSVNCAHWIMADLAVWMAGHVSVPLFQGQTAESLGDVIEHADLRLLFLGPTRNWASVRDGIPSQLSLIGLPGAPEEPSLLGWDTVMASCEPLKESPRPDPESLASILYTSGTTGTPKGVMLSFSAMAFSALNAIRLLGVDQHDRAFCHMPLAHVAERQSTEICMLMAGGSLYFCRGRTFFRRDIRRAKPTVLMTVPHVLERMRQGVEEQVPQHLLGLLLRMPWYGALLARRIRRELGFDSLRYLVCGGGVVPERLLDWYRRIGILTSEVYGMTENCGYSHLGRPRKPRKGRIGLPNPGVECRLDSEGQLLVRSKANMLGYYKDDSTTAEALDAEGFLHTGDLADIDNEGFLRLAGRLSERFKTSKGHFVLPADIEVRLREHPQVAQACVLGEGLPQPLALLQLARESEGDRSAKLESSLRELLATVNAQLGRHQRLACLIVIVDDWQALPGFITPTRKLRRHRVEATYRDMLPLWAVSGREVVWQQPSE
ncbi:AMP-binding protein [Halopseudomonas yangmingensis]|uniref:Long-chain acyl-CoA synthetase (AMP-forming) n=1 Tax=Halopseudomonas yangmingensis TaxID=1720063 RepID=A0A1I4QCY8_9GAMM|nr:AMP-binding protein [Halopseudomonas yangmingensis]SFM37656.1 Long-chain acyl-CoA synthetase (AMP-forming) [Halopseudomonas yangmingensis]